MGDMNLATMIINQLEQAVIVRYLEHSSQMQLTTHVELLSEAQIASTYSSIGSEELAKVRGL